MLNQASKGVRQDPDVFGGKKLPHSPSIGPAMNSSSNYSSCNNQRLFKSTLKNLPLSLTTTVKKGMRRVQGLILWLFGPSTIYLNSITCREVFTR